MWAVFCGRFFLWTVPKSFLYAVRFPRGDRSFCEVCLMYAVFCMRYFLYAVPKSLL